MTTEHEPQSEPLAIIGKHLEDCCRTDIGWREQMDSHAAAVDAFTALEDELREAREKLERIRSAAGTTPLVSLPWLLKQVDSA